MAWTDNSPVWKRKTPGSSRLRTKSITQSELAKRPDPFFLPNLLDGFEESKFGWLADGVKRLCVLKTKLSNGSISLEDIEARELNKPVKAAPILITDSDDEFPIESATRQEERANKFKETEGVVVLDDEERSSYATDTSAQICDGEGSPCSSTDNDNGTSLNREREEEEEDELWRQMAFSQESYKVTVDNSQSSDLKQVEDCEHSFIYKDDTGEVCRVCGLIKKPIESMIEVVFNKPKRSRRT